MVVHESRKNGFYSFLEARSKGQILRMKILDYLMKNLTKFWAFLLEPINASLYIFIYTFRFPVIMYLDFPPRTDLLLIHFMALASFYTPPENITKPEVV